MDALQTDLPLIEELLQEHTDIVAAAKGSGAPTEAQAELEVRRNGFEILLKRHRADIATTIRDIETSEHALQRLEASERVRWIYQQLEDRRGGFIDELVQTVNSLVTVAVFLGEERRELNDLYAEATALRRDLVSGLALGDAKAELEILGVAEPQELRNRPPSSWRLRDVIVQPESGVVNRAVGVLDDLLKLRNPNLEFLHVRLKQD